MTTYNRNEIEPIPVKRVSTGFEDLDWIYGRTDQDWGIPMRTISLWAGEIGTGKSRTAVAVCNEMASRGKKILYFQAESDLGTFSKKAKYDIFRLSDSEKLEDIIKDIKHDKPDIVVIDSVNMIKEFGSGTKKEIESIVDELRIICKTIGSHIILLGQLNQDGTIKGSTTLPHLVDIALNIQKNQLEGVFVISVGVKQRYGRAGKKFNTGWRHLEDGVECFTENRRNDEQWNLVNRAKGREKSLRAMSKTVTPNKSVFSIIGRK